MFGGHGCPQPFSLHLCPLLYCTFMCIYSLYATGVASSLIRGDIYQPSRLRIEFTLTYLTIHQLLDFSYRPNRDVHGSCA